MFPCDLMLPVLFYVCNRNDLFHLLVVCNFRYSQCHHARLNNTSVLGEQ